MQAIQYMRQSNDLCTDACSLPAQFAAYHVPLESIGKYSQALFPVVNTQGHICSVSMLEI